MFRPDGWGHCNANFVFVGNCLKDLKDLKQLIQTNINLRVIIIVVIITWPGEKPSQEKNCDITVFRVSDLLKWLMFMQNFEHGVTVFNQ